MAEDTVAGDSVLSSCAPLRKGIEGLLTYLNLRSHPIAVALQVGELLAFGNAGVPTQTVPKSGFISVPFGHKGVPNEVR